MASHTTMFVAVCLLGAFLALASARPDPNKCISEGWKIGESVAKDACDNNLRACKNANRLFATVSRAVLPTDCWNKAFTTCVARAEDRNQIACSFAFDNGVEKCSAQQFAQAFKDEVTQACKFKAEAIDKALRRQGK